MSDHDSGQERDGLPIYQQQIANCLDHARDLIDSAERVLGSDNRSPNIAHHLAILSLEEVGKAGMLAARAVVSLKKDTSKLDDRLGSHVDKLMWAVWSPSVSNKLDPKDFEAAKQFAQSTHRRRLAGLYTDYENDDEASAPPRDAVTLEQATSLVALAKTRLELQRAHGTSAVEPNEDLEWFLDTVTDEFGKPRLFSPTFVQKYEELGGDVRAWVHWSRGEFARIAAEETARLKQEMTRSPDLSIEGQSKWKMKVRVYSASHTIRQKVLHAWNNGIDHVKLNEAGGNNELLLELTLGDHVLLERLFETGLSLSKMIVLMLNIGTAGFFWFELSNQAERYFEEVDQLDLKGFKLVIPPRGLARRWGEELPNGHLRRPAVEDIHIERTVKCFLAFGRMPEAQAAPIFQPYFAGLALLSKTDLHLSFEAAGRDAFFRSLRAAMLHFNDWDGNGATLLTALHEVMKPVMEKEEERAQVFASVLGLHAPKRVTLRERLIGLFSRKSKPPPQEPASLEDAVLSKQLVDLYLTLIAERRAVDAMKEPNGA